MTLNQSITQLRTLSLSHKQIRHFFFGEGADWDTMDLEYSAVLCQIIGVRILTVGVEVDYTLYIADLVSETPEDVNNTSVQANTIEVQSDMLSVANDISAMLQSEDYDWLLLSSPINVEMYSDTPLDNDRVAGCKMDFTLRLPMKKCEIIIND